MHETEDDGTPSSQRRRAPPSPSVRVGFDLAV